MTRYFFNSLLLSGDLVFTTKSHQNVLIATLAEFASRHGLKPKVLSRDTNDFPGGHAFHQRPQLMKDIFQGKVHPYIFHMSWTENKDNKLLYLRQMGEWYVNDKCIGSTTEKILGMDSPREKGSLLAHCCAAEPIFSCHYKDKPSKEPCPFAPNIVPQGESFW